MSQARLIGFGAAAIEMLGAALLSAFLIWSAVRTWVDRQPSLRARAIAAEGIVFTLDFKLAATLLKSLLLAEWRQIGSFAAILVLRMIIKRQMVWQERVAGV